MPGTSAVPNPSPEGPESGQPIAGFRTVSLPSLFNALLKSARSDSRRAHIGLTPFAEQSVIEVAGKLASLTLTPHVELTEEQINLADYESQPTISRLMRCFDLGLKVMTEVMQKLFPDCSSAKYPERCGIQATKIRAAGAIAEVVFSSRTRFLQEDIVNAVISRYGSLAEIRGKNESRYDKLGSLVMAATLAAHELHLKSRFLPRDSALPQ